MFCALALKICGYVILLDSSNDSVKVIVGTFKNERRNQSTGIIFKKHFIFENCLPFMRCLADLNI